jgi:lauroyl/myristoyl acyltransferase
LYEWIGKITGNERLHRRLANGLGRLPEVVLHALLAGIGYVMYRLAGGKARRHIEENMLDVLDISDRRALRRLGRAYFVNLAVTLYEILIGVYRLPALREAGRIGDLFAAEGERRLDEALRHGKGAIVYAPHVGNFFYAYWYLTQKYDCLAVVTAESPELRPIYLKFRMMGCRGLDYDRTPPLELVRRLRKHLAAGGVLFLLGDFYRPTFPRAELFGRLTRSPEGTASLGIEQQAPVVPFYSYRLKRFRHRLVFGTPLLLHERFSRNERRQATDELNRFLEFAIRSVPAQWFYWFNAEERWETEEGSIIPQEQEAN